ncbi:MAG TPA: Ku protein [Geobacteraceae bacterium]
MAMQGIWSGTISFSLVAIPVQLVRAVAPGRVSFRLLHDEDFSPLARRMFCPEQEGIVPPEEIVRGYEIAPDMYIPITDEELESVTPERSRTIEIVEFIDMEEVDPLYFDHPYYLVPLKGGEKAYRLLVEVMAETATAGLAKFVLAEREYLVAVKSTQGALSLITLHYSDEILPAAELQQGKVQTAALVGMKKSIKAMMAEFDPEKYADERRKKVMALLEQKAKEQPPVQAPVPEETEGEGPADLMAALTEAMAQVKKNR